MKGRRISAALCVLAFCLLCASPALATKYVALGDSYSSGTGTRTFYESACQRSVYAYPYLLHNAHPEWTFVNASCAGAKTGDVINTQVTSVTSDTNWVTYTIGGNDAGFSSVRRRWRLVDGVDKRPLQPDGRKLPPEGHRSRERLLPGGERSNGLI